MKKFINLCLCFIVCLGICMPYFSNVKINGTAKAETIYDSKIEFKQDIISINKSDLGTQDAKYAHENQTPYDRMKNEMMPGCSITPASNSHNEIISQSFFTKTFHFTQNESIFLWIYFPDNPYENFYSLNLKFFNINGGYVEWNLSFSKLLTMMTSSYTQKYGWKLLELSYNDAEKVKTNDTLDYIRFQIDYSLDLEELKKYYEKEFGKFEIEDTVYDFIKTNGKMAFYHIFLGDKIKDEVNMRIQLSYANYDLKESFIEEFNEIYLGDSYKLRKLSDMFEFIYVGKYNLLYSGEQGNLYTFSFYIVNDNGTFELKENDSVPFKMKVSGTNNFQINVEETRNDEQVTIISRTISFNCVEYQCGTFDKSEYTLSGQEVYTIPFKFYESFRNTGEVTFKVSNNKLATIEKVVYDEENDCYYLSVKCIKNGRTEIIATTKGTRGDSIIQEYTAKTKLRVTNISISMFASPVTWVFVGILGVAIIVFIIVSMINLRKAKKYIK